MRLSPVLLVVVLLLLAVPVSAGAAVRQVVPSGGATSGPCDAGAPCTLADAIAGASSGDTVRVGSGTYDLASTLDVTVGGLVVEGQSAAAPPLLQWSGSPNASAVSLSGTGQTLRGLQVRGTVNGAAILVRADGTAPDATLDRVQVRNEGTGTAVALRGSLLRDSVVTSIGAGSIAAMVSGAVTSSTIVAEGADARALYASTFFFGESAAATVRNTILRGDVSGWDGSVYDKDNNPATSASLDIDFSSYGAGRLRKDTAFASDSATATEGAANVTTVGPLLAGLPGGLDLHQLRGSPTIDAGSGAVTLGGLDIDGDPRVFGAATDIGADEYLPPPLATIQSVVVDDTRASVTGLVTPRGSDTTWSMEYGTTTAYGTAVPGGPVPGTAPSQSVTASLAGLKPATTYHVRLIATSSRGTTLGPDATFRTLAAPGGAVSTVRPTISSARLVSRSVRRGKLAGVRVRSSAAGTLEIAIERLQKGRRRGKACVAAKRRRCTAYVRIGGLARKVLPGDNGPLPIVTAKLRKARYRLTLSVVGTNGKRSALKTLTLRIR